MTFPAYPNYKSTGVEWLSEIPVHWELIRLRFLLLDGAEGIKIGPFGSQLTSDMLVEVGYKVYGQENVIAGDFDKGRRYITDEKFSEMSVYEIRPNDLLVTMMGTAGRCKVVPEAISAGVMDSHLLRMRFGRKADPKFVELLIDKSNYVSHQVRLNGKGSIMHGLNSSIIKELLVALPSADEQASILSFLDHETARIDALIEEQQRLIELLKEKRQAVISHAVTKGLDPTVPMKDSGVEWLGEVPAHWEVKHMKYLVKDGESVSYGIVQPGDHQDEGVPFIQTTNMSSGDFSFDSLQRTSPEIEANYPRSRLKGGEVILGIRATIGAAFVVPVSLKGINLSRGVARVECSERMLPDYLVYFLSGRAAFEYWELAKQGSTFSEVSIATVRELPVTVPPLIEQQELIEYLERAVKGLDDLAEIGEQAMAFLRERRSALISAAVTGKIDVRGWQPPASAQAPEPAVAEAV